METVVASFDILSRHLLGGSEKNIKIFLATAGNML
jgi:hypothetical protein